MKTISLPTTINSKGIQEIKEFLQANHRNCTADLDFFDLTMLQSWALDAEFQLGEGNPPRIEIKSYDSVCGATVDFTVSNAGVDFSDFELEE